MAGFGFSIYTLVHFTQAQAEAEERQEKLKELEKELAGIQENMNSIVKNSYFFNVIHFGGWNPSDHPVMCYQTSDKNGGKKDLDWFSVFITK